MRADSPDSRSASRTTLRSPRCSARKSNTSLAATSAGSFATTAKNVFRSNATARGVFGRDRPATNSRYRSTSRWPSEYRTSPAPDTVRTRHGKLLIGAPSHPGRMCPYASDITRVLGVRQLTRSAVSRKSGHSLCVMATMPSPWPPAGCWWPPTLDAWPGPDPRAGRPGHRRPRRRRRARPGRLRADGRGPALAELMPCSRVTTCGIGPNPALSPARSRPRPDPVPAGCCLPLGMSRGISTRSSHSCLLRSSGPARRTCRADLFTNSTPRVAPHDLAAVNPRRIRTLLAMGLPRPAAG